MGKDSTQARHIEPSDAARATCFTMRGLPLLAQGDSFNSLGTAENLWLAVKVYASGGENALHHHRTEDHAFVIIQGKATFEFADGSTSTLGQYEGILLPKGVFYKFQAHEEENLVLLRVGGAQRKIPGAIGPLHSHGGPVDVAEQTFDADGERKSATSKMSGSIRKKMVEIPGKFFMGD